MYLRFFILLILFDCPLHIVSERDETGEENIRKTLADLSVKYDGLCHEIRIMSQHIVFLEQALSDLSHHGDVQYRKKRETDDDNVIIQNAGTFSPNNVASSNSVQASEPTSPATDLPQTIDDDSFIVVRQDDPADHAMGSDATTTATSIDKEELDSSAACACNMLHEYSCPIDSSKAFDNQFNDWYHNLLFSMSQNCSQGAKEFAARNERTKHFRKHHKRPNRNIRHGVVSNGQKPVIMTSSQMDQMEHSLAEEEHVYATCDVIPNRHISLILQQNVKGRINLWQRNDGQGPMQAHVQLSGFRVTVSDRKRRETNLMPVKTSSETSPSPPLSLEHGFHVHASGDLSRSCQSTGTHFNPSNSSHGGPMDSIRHVGDLGNLRVTENGTIDAEYSYPYVSLVGENGIIGKSLVIHAQADDYGRLSTGNSGPKIACCVIEKVAKLPFAADSMSTVEAVKTGA